jgi:putative MATE family efflux protein
VNKFFKVLRDALKGKDIDLTNGSLDKAILMLAIPMVFEMFMESLFALVDAFFVARISVDAIAAVGMTESCLTIVYSLAWGLSMGVTALVARRIGEENRRGAADGAMQAIILGVLFSIFISLIGIFYSKKLLLFMGASPAIIKTGLGYIQWMLGGNIVIMLLYLINGIFRGAGDAAIAMRALWISNGINIIIDPILIFGVGPIPAMGVEGAGIATVIGRGIGVVYQLYHLLKGSGKVQLFISRIIIQWDVILKIVKLSTGGTAQFIIASASWIFLMKIISSFGSEAVAGYTLAIRIIVFTILPSWGMANAAATMVGQNLGASKPDRAEKAVYRTGFFNVLFMICIMMLFLVFAESLMRIFTQEALVIHYGKLCLQIVSLGYAFYGYGMIMAQAFNGAGDTRTPTLLNFFAFWCFQIPFAYFLAIVLKMEAAGVFTAIVVAESLLAVSAVLIFRRGKWKQTKV